MRMLPRRCDSLMAMPISRASRPNSPGQMSSRPCSIERQTPSMASTIELLGCQGPGRCVWVGAPVSGCGVHISNWAWALREIMRPVSPMNSRDHAKGMVSEREFKMVRMPFSYTMIPDPGMSALDWACLSVSMRPTTHWAGAPAKRRSKDQGVALNIGKVRGDCGRSLILRDQWRRRQ